MMLVGEQPGDQEDRQGHPFVGPAGRLLGRALEEAGIDRSTAYLTNAVKHFKFEARGKRRLHKTPSATEVRACRPWLEAEIEALAPDVLVALGSVAGKALFGSSFRVTRQRGEVLDTDLGPLAVPTVHPDRADQFDRFVADLQVAAGLL
jgi:DNA polymerase